jgi:hypothetical protein
VTGETYILTDDSTANYIEVLDTNQVKNEMSGRFEITMIPDPRFGKVYEWSPDTLKFRNGVFLAKLRR